MTQNLKLRIITALIGAPVMMGLLFGFGVEGVALISWVISTGMWFEFGKMFFKLEDRNEKIAILLVFNTLIHAANYWMSVGVPAIYLGLAPTFLISVMFLLQVPRLLHYRGAEVLNTPDGVATVRQHVFEWACAVFGMVYCTWFPLLMVSIRTLELGKHYLAFTLLAVWSSDTFAYFAGKGFGRKALFPSVSPKKTREGAIGGAAGAVIVTEIYAHFFLQETSPVTLGLLCLVLSAASIVGDLCESLLKRAMECKDSGSILPGHGGFLDRFDGVVFALPVMYLYLRAIY